MLIRRLEVEVFFKKNFSFLLTLIYCINAISVLIILTVNRNLFVVTGLQKKHYVTQLQLTRPDSCCSMIFTHTASVIFKVG